MSHRFALCAVAVLASFWLGCGSDDTSNGAGGGDGGSPDGSMAADGSTGDGGGGDGSTGDGGTTDGSARDGSPPPPAGESVLMHHKNPSRDGVYVQPAFTKAAAANLTRDTSFAPTLQGPLYAQPLFVDGGGGRDLVIAATESNNVYAFDAANGSQVWTRNLGPSVPLSKMPCGNINPYGVTGAPVIDLPSRTLFVNALTSADGGTTKKHLVFAISIDDGTVKSGWPVDVAAKATSGGTTFTVDPQGQRGALAVVNGRVYIPYGGLFGDCGTYYGWLVSIAITDPTNVSAWATGARGGGAWAPSGVASDGANVYIATGNTFGASTWAGGEAVLRFAAGATLTTPSYWAPTNWKMLDNGDVDIGGSGAVVFDLPGSNPSALAVALGKDGMAYILDRNNLGGVGNAVAAAHVASGQIINAPAVYSTPTATYVTFAAAGAMCTGGTSGNLATIKIVPGSPPTIAGSWCASGGGNASPMVTTTDGHANAIVWIMGIEGDSRLHGYDGDTGAAIYSGTATISGMRRFQTPIAAKGRLFVPTDTTILAYKP